MSEFIKKIEITIVFYTLHLTCMQIFAAIGGERAEILGGGVWPPPPPSKNLVWNSPVKIGLSWEIFSKILFFALTNTFFVEEGWHLWYVIMTIFFSQACVKKDT